MDTRRKLARVVKLWNHEYNVIVVLRGLLRAKQVLSQPTAKNTKQTHRPGGAQAETSATLGCCQPRQYRKIPNEPTPTSR